MSGYHGSGEFDLHYDPHCELCTDQRDRTRPEHEMDHIYASTLDDREGLDAADLLRPFAAMGGDWAMPPFHDLEADIVVWESAGKAVTAGDVRAARRYLDGHADLVAEAHERILVMCDHTLYFDSCASCVLRAALEGDEG